MKEKMIIVCGIGVLLAGCGGLTPQSSSVSLGQAAAVISAKALPDSVVEKIVNTCEKYGGVLKYATLPMLPELVRETAVDAAAYCEQIVPAPLPTTAAAAVVTAPKTTVILPPTTDQNTSSWMDKVIWGLKTAERLTKIKLPGF